MNCTLYESPEFCSNDHRLVEATLWVHLKSSFQFPPDISPGQTEGGMCSKVRRSYLCPIRSTLSSARDSTQESSIGEWPGTRQNRRCWKPPDVCCVARLTDDRDLRYSLVRKTGTRNSRPTRNLLRRLKAVSRE